MNLPHLAPGYYAMFLEDFRKEMCLGVTEAETSPQLVRIDIACICQRLAPGDGIEAVIDYNHLREAALDVATGPHIGLQETMCEALIERLRGHRGVAGVVVETRKLHVFHDAGGVGCRMADIDPEALGA